MKKITQTPSYYFNAYFDRGASLTFLQHIVHKKRVDKILSNIPPNSEVLDVGCGSGVLLYLLKARAQSLMGLDIRKDCLKFIQSLKILNCSLICADARNFSLRKKFDVVVCSDVIEHFLSSGRKKTLLNLYKHLKDGGLMVIVFPSKFYIKIVQRIWFSLRKILCPSIVFDDESQHFSLSPNEIVSIMEGIGCSPKKSHLFFGMLHYVLLTK